MEALYDRMAVSISQNLSATDRALAYTILQCVTCSLRALVVAELARALGGNVSEMLDLKRSIVDLCGGFVVIDNGGNVVMIHQTAREYLLGGDDRPFHVVRDAAHKQMFLSCMRCLMTTGLRAKVSRNQKPEFLEYAATSWSSHLAPAPLDCTEVGEILNKFLTGQWVLTWIQFLATNRRRGALIQASQNLLKYSAKLKAHNELRDETGSHVLKLELVDCWAVDFVKIVGKFGVNLRRNPEAIYKLVPPFCPRNSAIYRLFGTVEAKSLAVHGLSDENWDDLLARMSPGFGIHASSIAAAGGQIAMFAPEGRVFIYDSSIFEETAASPIRHGERMYRMVMNSSGTLLVTYGYRSIKIWEVLTGKCKLSVDNMESRPRPLAMLLTNNGSMLLVGSDDRRIRSLDLSQPSPNWHLVAELDEPEIEGCFLNASSYMAINKDGSLIAVAYRGHPFSAWEVDGPVHIGHCWRARKEIARGEVRQAVWLPHSPEVLGLYIEGIAFKWRPYEGKVEEFATGASQLAISDNGTLFATGDVYGTVKVFTTSDCCLLYQLASQDPVWGLTFSPDSCRFYDVRGDYGNAWEPNSLMGFSGQIKKYTDSESETDSLTQSSTPSMSWSPRVDSITVLAGSPVGRLYCCGTVKGTVRLHDMHSGKITNLHTSRSFFSVGQMSWSQDGLYICFSDPTKTVFVVPISWNHGTSEPIVGTKVEIPLKNTNGPILQLLFEPNSSRLLVHTPSMIRTVSLRSFSVIHSSDLQSAECKWIVHPQDPGLIMGVGPGTIFILDWELTEQLNCYFDYPLGQVKSSPPEGTGYHDTVDRILVRHNKKHILVQISLRSRSAKDKAFLSFPLSPIQHAAAKFSSKEAPVVIQPTILAQDISSQIASALFFLSRDRLVFLSRTFSVCSWPLSAGSNPPAATPVIRTSSTATTTTASFQHRHGSFNSNVSSISTVDKMTTQFFSLPGDWVSKDCLALCSIWRKKKPCCVGGTGRLQL